MTAKHPLIDFLGERVLRERRTQNFRVEQQTLTRPKRRDLCSDAGLARCCSCKPARVRGDWV